MTILLICLIIFGTFIWYNAHTTTATLNQALIFLDYSGEAFEEANMDDLSSIIRIDDIPLVQHMVHSIRGFMTTVVFTQMINLLLLLVVTISLSVNHDMGLFQTFLQVSASILNAALLIGLLTIWRWKSDIDATCEEYNMHLIDIEEEIGDNDKNIEEDHIE